MMRGPSHLPGSLKYLTATRGRWEGNTLVVVRTSNGLTGVDGGGRSDGSTLTVFTLLDKDMLHNMGNHRRSRHVDAALDVVVSVEARAGPTKLFEYACHEGTMRCRSI